MRPREASLTTARLLISFIMVILVWALCNPAEARRQRPSPTAAAAPGEMLDALRQASALPGWDFVESLEHDQRQSTLCLALSVYHEARGSTGADQLAVAIVARTRAHNPMIATACAEIDTAIRARSGATSPIKVAAHKGIELNERADSLATIYRDRAARMAMTKS